jgi:phosphonate transport system permease protein
MLDWISWGYVAYGIVYLLNHYWYTNIHYYGRLTVPEWGWPIVILGTLELTVASHAFGHSLGQSMFGLRLLTESYTLPSLRQRWQRFLGWHLSLIAFPVTIWNSTQQNRMLHDRLSGTQMFVVKEIKDVMPLIPPRAWYKTNRGLMSVVLIGTTLWVGWLVTEIDLHTMFSRIGTSVYLWEELLSPHFTHFITPDPTLQQSIVGGMLETVFMALLASTVGAILAFPLSFLGARNIMGINPVGWLIYTVVRGFFNAVRSVEALLWGTIFAVWVGFGPFAGVLALATHTVAALGKLYSEQVEGVDPGPLEAIAATGARRWQVILYGVVPQIIPSYLAFTLYRWDINVRMATVIALVGGGGLGRIMFFYKNQVGKLPDAWNQVGAVILVIVAVVWALDYISGRVREKII